MEAIVYIGSSKIKQIKEMFKKEAFSYIFVNDQSLNKKVIDLFKEESIEIKNKKYNFDFILFKDMKQEDVFTFRNKYKNFICAILTDTNKDWIFNNLLNEINEEHTYIQSKEKLQMLLKQANLYPKDKYTSKSYFPYQNACMKGLMYMNKDVNLITLNTVIKEIETTRKQLKKK